MTANAITSAAIKSTTKTSLFLIEFYTKHPRTGETGWDIKFAWVEATNADEAKRQLAEAGTDDHGRKIYFDCVITIEEQARIYPVCCGEAFPIRLRPISPRFYSHE